MNLQRVKPWGSLPIQLRCKDCEKWTLDAKCFADLDGEPFKDYYCEQCADVKQQERAA